ncbi:hypothetical protein [Desulfosoma sp.]
MNEILPDGFQMSELATPPEGWRIVRLGEVATLSTKAVDPANGGVKSFV